MKQLELDLKKGEDEFLDDWRLREIIKKYSDHITLPIVMKKTDFKDGETITLEPFSANAFPVIIDLVVDRSSFDRVQQARARGGERCAPR